MRSYETIIYYIESEELVKGVYRWVRYKHFVGYTGNVAFYEAKEYKNKKEVMAALKLMEQTYDHTYGGWSLRVVREIRFGNDLDREVIHNAEFGN